jgi:uncharacterized protein
LKAVANSCVLIALSTIGQLDLLHRRVPDGVLIPRAVWHEVVETGVGQPGAAEVASAAWITTCRVQDEDLVSLLRAEVDEGEAEAIALCRESRLELILLDEKDARRPARRLNLAVLGTVGILIWAKRVELLGSLQQQLDVLRAHGRFLLSESVYHEALRSVGEA